MMAVGWTIEQLGNEEMGDFLVSAHKAESTKFADSLGERAPENEP